MEWTSVYEQSPPDGDEVLIAGELRYAGDPEYEYFVDIGVYIGHSGSQKWLRHPAGPDNPDDWIVTNDWDEGQDEYRITHWMKIPVHPKEVKEDG